MVLAASSFLAVNAQEIPEPDFVGEAILVRANQDVVPLDKSTSQNRSVASTGLIMTGIGKVRTQIQIDGCCSSVKVKKNEKVQFIIKNVDNQTDPMSIIRIFKFEPKKNVRRAELSSVSSLGGAAKSNNLAYVPFKGKKYGTSSYLITLDKQEIGEYGIIISNPNSLDEKSVIVSSFAITN